MKFLSLCSGIDAASVASAQLDWECVGFSEIEQFPCEVLAHRYPSVPNLGDMTKFEQWPESVFTEADAIVGGPPCQAFSMAGKRAGLDDSRGNLTLIYANLIDHADRIRRAHGKSPVWCLYENVPGLLSDRTNAFGCLLGKLAGEDVPLLPTGGKWTNAGFVSGPARAIAWRTLDAQYFGVAQRRRRVFVVASAGNLDPAKVLFESEGVRRDTPPRREAGKGIAGIAPFGVGERGEVGHCLRSQASKADKHESTTYVCLAHGQANAETRTDGGAPTLTCNHEAPIVTYAETPTATLCCNGDANSGFRDEHGLVAETYALQNPTMVNKEQGGTGISEAGAPMYTLEAQREHGVADLSHMAVRRLTPTECERLQGFPDGYTAIPHKGKPADQCPDGPRYKALGNSWAVPCVRWIFSRIK